jgi:hypothetical protein
MLANVPSVPGFRPWFPVPDFQVPFVPAFLSQESDVLQKLNAVKREIIEGRKKVFYRSKLKRTSFLQSYYDGQISLFLNFVFRQQINDESPVETPCWSRASSKEFTVCVSSRNPVNDSDWVKIEKENMLVRNVEFVKRPDGRIVPSFVRLNLGHDASVERWAPGIHLNPMKGSVDFLLRIPNGETCFGGDFFWEKSSNRIVPSEIQGAPQVMDGIRSNQGQVIQGVSEVWNFVNQGLSAVRVLLDCGCATIFQSNMSRCKLSNVFIGPSDFETGIPVRCAHKREVYADTTG